MFGRIRNHARKVALAAGLAAAGVAVTAAPAHASGTPVYVITSTLSSLAVDVSGGSTGSGAAVIQWPRNGGQNQEWTLTSGSYGWQIVNYNSNLCLSLVSAAGGAGTSLVQYPCVDQPYMEWTFEGANTNTANIIRNAASRQVVDIPGGSGTWGTQLDQWPGNGGPNQTFWFTKVA